MLKKKAKLEEIKIDQIIRGRFQPRVVFDNTALEELAASIQSTGIIQPIVVRNVSPNTFEIIAGERRWRAAKLAGLKQVACLVSNYSDAETAAMAAIENINRVDLNPIEEANAYQRLIDEFAYSHEEIASIVGKSRAKITNTLRLLKLTAELQQHIIENRLTEGHGKVLATLDATEQTYFANLVVENEYNVRTLEHLIKQKQKSKNFTKMPENPNIKALEDNLAIHIGAQVKINYQKERGQLTIDFHNLDILQGILKKMGYDPNKI